MSTMTTADEMRRVVDAETERARERMETLRTASRSGDAHDREAANMATAVFFALDNVRQMVNNVEFAN